MKYGALPATTDISPIASDADHTKILERFVSDMDTSDLTKQLYQKRLQYFFIWLTKEKILRPEREHVLQYRRSLKAKGLEANSIGSYLVAVRSFFEWASNQGIYPNISANIKGVKRSKGFRRDALTLDQAKKLLGALSGESIKQKRDRALINVLLRAGLRTIEISRANIEDLTQISSDSKGLWVQGKGHDSKDQYVILTEDCLAPIMDYLSARNNLQQSSPLFASTSDGNFGQRLSTRSIRKVVKEYLRKVSLNHPRLSAHSLRHTCVSLSIEAGATLIETQQMARHESAETTLKYAHGLERAKGIAEKCVEEILRR